MSGECASSPAFLRALGSASSKLSSALSRWPDRVAARSAAAAAAIARRGRSAPSSPGGQYRRRGYVTCTQRGERLGGDQREPVNGSFKRRGGPRAGRLVRLALRSSFRNFRSIGARMWVDFLLESRLVFAHRGVLCAFVQSSRASSRGTSVGFRMDSRRRSILRAFFSSETRWLFRMELDASF